MHLNHGAATDIGRKRSKNQDSIAAAPDLGLFLVADGMGGHQGGEIASSMAAEVIEKSIREAQKRPGYRPQTAISEAIRAANDAIYKHARTHAELSNMGTTTTAILVTADTLVIGHVGDSRCYFVHPNDNIWQLTRDHSLVQEKLRAGLITRDQVKTDKMKNVITRSVGFEPRIDVDVYEMKFGARDIFLICSDGLSGLVEDNQILQLIQKTLVEQGNIQQTVSNLIETANANGGDDNISAVVVQILGKS